jgi:translocation and assembly module TamB
LHALPVGASSNAAWLVADGLQVAIGIAADGTPSALQAAPGELQLLGARLKWDRLAWQSSAGGATPRVELDAQLQPMKVAPLLARLQPDFGWGGDLELRGRAQVRTAGGFSADVVLERAGGDLTVTDEGGVQTLGLSTLRLGLAASGGIWHFTEAAAGGTIGVLAGAQSLRVPAGAIWPDPHTPMEGVLELRVDKLDVWGPWTPPGWRLAGSLHTVATLGGRFDAPEYTGHLEGHGIGARNLLQGVDVHDGEVAIALKGPSAQIERFTAKAGDGTVSLSGGASFGDAPRAQLALQARHFQLLGRVDRRIVASGTAQLALDATALKLDGRFGVDEGLIDFSRSSAPTLDDDVTVIRPARGGAAAPGEEPAPARASRPVQLALDVDLGQKLHVRGRGLDAFLRGELRMSTPGSRLAVNGAVRAEYGTYRAYGQKLDIERGSVDFAGPVDNPRLDILAVRPNLDVRVGVAVTGTAQSPRVRLFSEPEMADADKLSWLVLGREPGSVGTGDAALLQQAAMALLAGEGESTSDKVIHSLGLDEISLRQQTEGDFRSTVVSLGKQISQRWYVGYERGVNSTTGSWQLIYRIAQRFTLRAQSGDDNALDFIWIWRWN